MTIENVTDRELAVLDFRKNKVKQKVREIESILSGSMLKLSDWIEIDGKYSEAKTWKLVDQLIGCLERYRKSQYEEVEETLYQEDEEILSEAEYQFYRSFLYCAIRIANLNPWWYWATSGTFEDINRMARELEKNFYYLEDDLYATEICMEETMDGFLGCMDDLYRRITGEEISTSFTSLQKEKAKKTSIYMDYEMAVEQCAEQEEMRELYLEQNYHTEEEMQEGAEEYLYESEREHQMEEDIAALPHKEEICKQYQLFRAVFFNTYIRSNFVETIDALLTVFFYINNQSIFSDDEEFFKIYTLLNKIVKEAKHGEKRGE